MVYLLPGDNNENVVGIFLGSADDSILRCYVPSTNNPRSLVRIDLPEEHFTVDTPVLALDFCSVTWSDNDPSTTNTLAIACQDGTVQLVTWTDGTNEDENNPFCNLTSQKVIVDGPLVCLKLDYNQYSNSLRVIVGSLCGYVCQLTYDNRNSIGPCWEGPFMIAQDLWNPFLNAEDSVLAVDVCDNYVAVGTQLGRCILYGSRDCENYIPVWYSLLPYSVHGIVLTKNSEVVDDEVERRGDEMTIAVTTRRSFHLFRAKEGSVKWDRKPSKQQYLVETARNYLLKILEDVRKENEEEDAKTRAMISETVDDIVDRIEETHRVEMDISPSATSEHETNEVSEAFTIASSAIETLLDRVDHELDAANGTYSSSSNSEQNEPSVITARPQLEYSSSEDETETAMGDLEVTNTDESSEGDRIVADTSDTAADTAPIYEDYVMVEPSTEEPDD